ncbi:hypothetical protein F480_02365 [Bibersteinia trehalosi Y31]|uniref:Uncharacterized protein n=1 Tax=Bibersteinia trehalosi Y31 TaxID=1261658 RepID=A0A179D1X2_BIBTR|nr:hypothetical protein [Bibersteinia trehalosi]OAQ15808.1 hypothetical protein F480_02365 [Bibersteinia trehalosi Y31]
MNNEAMVEICKIIVSAIGFKIGYELAKGVLNDNECSKNQGVLKAK